MDIIDILGYVGALTVGLILGLVGGGGSILTVPLLVYVLGYNPVTATAYSLFVVGSSSLFGSVQKLRKGLADLKIGLSFSFPSFIAVYLSRRFLVPNLPEVFFSIHNFELTKESFSPNLSYNFDTSSQLEFIFEWTQIDNQINAKESLNQQQFALKFSSAFKSSSSLSAELRYIKNDYSGQNNTPVAYQLLEGLQTGENWTWSVVGQQKLTKTLDLNVNYFGRKTADLKTIHTGSIQLRANF